MANRIVAGEKQMVSGELYETLTGQLFELGRQLRQPNGYPFNAFRLKRHLQDAIEGKFAPGEIYGVRIGGATTTDEVVRAWRKAGLYAHDFITQANFPLTAHAEEEVEVEIIDPGCSFSEEEGLGFLKDAGLMRPTYEHALRFAEQCGRATSSAEKPYVVFLHEAWQDPVRYRRVLSVNRLPSRRSLFLYYPDHRFDFHCVLAGVRPRKQSSAA